MAGQVNIVYGAEISKVHKGITRINRLMSDQSKKMATNTKKNAKALKDAGRDTGGEDSFMSNKWFKGRMAWFAKLRVFWGIYRQLAKAIVGAFQFEQEMANVRAITQSTNEQFEKLREKALEVGVTTRFSAAEAAKGMVVMSQAGLDVEEILAAITNVANLATATLFDFEKTASLVVTIMRAWNLTATDSQRITDTLATSINRTKLNMHALVAGFNFVSGIAPQMNLTLEETTALLGTLANRGLSASTAATSLRAVMAALLNPTDKFKRTLKDVGLSVRDIDPRFNNMTTVLLKLRDAGFGVSEAFRAFRRRAAAGAAILISSAHEVEQLSTGMNELGRAAQMAEINLDTVEGQAKQFNDTMIATADTIFKDLDPAIKLAIQLFKTLAVDIFSLIKPLSSAIGWLAKYAQLLKTFTTRGAGGVDTEISVKELNELNNALKQTDKKLLNINNSYIKLETNIKKINQQTGAALEFSAKGKETDNIKKALVIAHQQHLITENQFDRIKKIKTVEKQVLELQKLIGAERARQIRVYARQEHILLTQQRLLKADIVKKTIEEVKKKHNLLVMSKEELKVAEKYVKIAQIEHDFNKEFETSGEDESRVALKKANKVRNKAQKQYNADLFETFRLVRAGGSESKEIIKVLGKEWKNTIMAMITAPNFAAFPTTLAEITSRGAQAANVSKKMVDSFIKSHDVAKDLPRLLARTSKERIAILKDAKSLEQQKIKILESNLKILNSEEKTAETIEKTERAQKKIKDLKDGIVGIDIKIEKLAIEESKVKLAALSLQYKINDADFEALQNANTKKELALAIAELQRNSKTELEALKQSSVLDEIRGNKLIDRLKNEKRIFDLQIKTAKLTLIEQESREKKFQQIEKIAAAILTISKAENEITINKERQLLATSAIARFRAELKADPLNFSTGKEFLNAEGGIFDTLKNAASGAGETGLGEIANLWREQREEAAELEEQLKGLNEQYQQALGEGNIEKARQLELQMANLRGRIDDLNNPVKNLANTFKQFALTVIEELQKVIIKMLVVKLIGMALGMFTNTGTGGSIATSGGGQMSIPAFQEFGGHNLVRGRGGLLPGGTFANFKKFARGGVTGGAGLAMLGDNPSGKELVIPSENISDNKVSGHVSDGKQPINIINVLTEQDIAAAMAGTEGQRTIINTIGKDIGKRGPTYRAMKT